MNKPNWTEKNRLESFQYGWSLFDCDNGMIEIQGLDDPRQVCWEHDISSLKVFAGKNRDRQAARFVQKRADEGDETCRLAIEMLIYYKSPDVKTFNLGKTW